MARNPDDERRALKQIQECMREDGDAAVLLMVISRPDDESVGTACAGIDVSVDDLVDAAIYLLDRAKERMSADPATAHPDLLPAIHAALVELGEVNQGAVN